MSSIKLDGAILLTDIDNVATAIIDLQAGKSIKVQYEGRNINIILNSPIPGGHKFAVTEIPNGGPIYKYGEVIGRATSDIKKGEHVHVHNVESLRGRGDLAGEGCNWKK